MVQTLVEAGREAQRVGAWDEALAHFETALAMLATGGDPKTRADLLRWSGVVHAERGSLDEARDFFERSREVAAEAQLEDDLAAALLCLANTDLLAGSLDRAASLFL